MFKKGKSIHRQIIASAKTELFSALAKKTTIQEKLE